MISCCEDPKCFHTLVQVISSSTHADTHAPPIVEINGCRSDDPPQLSRRPAPVSPALAIPSPTAPD